MNDDDGCDGCCLFHVADECFYNRNGSCPCKNCIIKMMCKKNCADLTAHIQRRDNI